MKNLEQLISASEEMIKTYYKLYDSVDLFEFDKIEQKSSLLIVIDINNGFAKKGALSSPRVEKLIPKIELLTFKCLNNNIHTVALTDSHKEHAKEFGAYPSHCQIGTGEEILVDELLKFNGNPYFHTIKKNSTNGFHVFNPFDEFKLLEMEYIENIIISGCVTDICVYQYALSLITYINEHALSTKVILPLNTTDTFDAPGHDGDLINLIYLNSLKSNGILLVSDII